MLLYQLTYTSKMCYNHLTKSRKTWFNYLKTVAECVKITLQRVAEFGSITLLTEA